MVFGGETAKAAASAAVVSEIQGVRVRLGDCEQGAAAVIYVINIIYLET